MVNGIAVLCDWVSEWVCVIKEVYWIDGAFTLISARNSKKTFIITIIIISFSIVPFHRIRSDSILYMRMREWCGWSGLGSKQLWYSFNGNNHIYLLPMQLTQNHPRIEQFWLTSLPNLERTKQKVYKMVVLIEVQQQQRQSYDGWLLSGPIIGCFLDPVTIGHTWTASISEHSALGRIVPLPYHGHTTI